MQTAGGRLALSMFAFVAALGAGPGPRATSAPPSLEPASVGWGSTRVDGHGVHLPTRRGDVALSLDAFGREGDMAAAATPRPTVVGDEIRIARSAGITEWWRSLDEGLEQGLTIESRPPGVGPLRFDHRVAAWLAPRLASDDEIELVAVETGRVVATYAHLSVVDADGTRLPARLAVAEGRARIEVDDTGARYPIVVDPVLYAVPEARVEAETPVTYGEYGRAVAISSDQSRAAIASTTVVDVFTRSGPDGSWAREATLPHGADHVCLSSDGTRLALALGSTYQVYARSGTSWALEATLPLAVASTSLALDAAGAVILVGVPTDTVAGASGAGRVYAFRRTGTSWASDGSVASIRPTAGGAFGAAVAFTVGGQAAVGAPGDDGFGADAGIVWIVYGSSGGWVVNYDLPPQRPSAGNRLGTSVAACETSNTIVAGMPGMDLAGGRTDAGALVVWTDFARYVIEPSVAVSGDRFGTNVAATDSGRGVIVAAGASFDDLPGATDAGSVYLFYQPDYAENVVLDAPTRATFGNFGGAVAVASDTGTDVASLVIGAAGPGEVSSSGAVGGAGAGYLYRLGPRTAAGDACAVGATCLSGECADGVCCTTACGNDASDCRACALALTGVADGTCAPVTSGAICRPSVGDCDVADVCDGTSTACPPDGVLDAGTTCRAPLDANCDMAEVCNGRDGTCPGDGFAPGGVVCRGAVGPCDVEERCTGSSASCPTDVFRSSSVVCEPAVGECDLDDSCTGASAECPPRVRPAGARCGSPPSGPCDTADACNDEGACVPMFLAGVECRASTGGCDPGEVCSGSESDCPPDQVAPSGTVCRASIDTICDPAESCDGASAICPVDQTTCASRPDVGPIDAGTDPPPPVTACTCRAADAGGARAAWWLGAILFAVLTARRERARGRR